jgi:hypothetical protein
MRDPLRREIFEVFDRQVGRPPAGIRERVLRGLAEPRPRPVWHRGLLPAVAAVALGALVVAALLISRSTQQQQHGVPAASPATPVSSPSPAETPQARIGAATVYDQARGRLVMFGGKIPDLAAPATGQIEPGAVTDETWTWDGTRWARPAPPAKPPARENALIAYDAARRQVVLYGGGLGTTLQDQELHDTWTWDGSTWTERPSTAAPPPSYQPALTGAVMAYDPASRTILLYVVTSQKLAITTETWRWDGARWTMPHPATEPAVVGAAMVSDGRRLLLVGGTTVAGQPETWAWDGAGWSRLTPATPLPAGAAAFAYDAARGRVVALVAPPSAGPWQTWTWDGTTWVMLRPAHTPSRAVSRLYDDTRSGLVVAYQPGRAGDQDWTWDGTDWSAAAGP